MFRHVIGCCQRLGVISCQSRHAAVLLHRHVAPTFSAGASHFHVQSGLCRPETGEASSQLAASSKQSNPVNDSDEYTESSGIHLPGLSDYGFMIPTLETHAALVNGVRYDELPIVNIHSSPNNTIMVLTDHTGSKFIARNSCGQEGFKNIKKSTSVAAQATGHTLGLKAMKKGVSTVRVLVKGLGAGRLPAIKGLQMAGMTIVSISDRTHVPHDAPRPRKARRL